MTDEIEPYDDDPAEAEGEPLEGELVEPAGELDLSAMLQQAQELLGIDLPMAEQAAAMAEAEITGRSGGGVVEVVMKNGDFTAVRIGRDAIDPDDPAMLEDLVLAALNDCMAQMAALMPEVPDFGNLFGSAD